MNDPWDFCAGCGKKFRITDAKIMTNNDEKFYCVNCNNKNKKRK